MSHLEDSAASSPHVSLQGTPEVSLTTEHFSPKHIIDAKDGFISEQSSEFLSVSERSHSVHSDELSVSDFSQYPRLVMPSSSGETTPSFSRGSFTNNSAQEQFTHYSPSEYDEDCLSASGNVSQSAMVPLKTPPSIDIASRRNRRPPQLAIHASRSYSTGGPRTGLDMGRRVDVGHSMRRVASATGTVRIAKQSGTPRSPFFERNPEALFQLNRSPNFSAATTTIAPPTPNTPVISNQQGLSEVTTSCALSLDEKFQPGLTIHDPTLRTPPTTPGIMEHMFTLDSAYDMAIPDEPLVTPGLGGFPSDFEMPGMSTNVPNYVATDGSSQPQTPSYAPQVGPTYYGYSGGNAEYNWSDASMSARSSPGQSQRHVQFMNMTPSNFTHIEK